MKSLLDRIQPRLSKIDLRIASASGDGSSSGKEILKITGSGTIYSAELNTKNASGGTLSDDGYIFLYIDGKRVLGTTFYVNKDPNSNGTGFFYNMDLGYVAGSSFTPTSGTESFEGAYMITDSETLNFNKSVSVVLKGYAGSVQGSGSNSGSAKLIYSLSE